MSPGSKAPFARRPGSRAVAQLQCRVPRIPLPDRIFPTVLAVDIEAVIRTTSGGRSPPFQVDRFLRFPDERGRSRWRPAFGNRAGAPLGDEVKR
jgi:hypothetical protein